MLPPTIHPSPSLTNVHEARDLPTCPCPYPSVEQAMSAGPIQPDLKSNPWPWVSFKHQVEDEKLGHRRLIKVPSNI